MFAALLCGNPRALAQGFDREPALRPYLSIRYGNYFFLDPDSVSNAVLKTPAQEQSPAVTLGVDVRDNCGFRVALDYIKTNLLEANGDKAGDYSTATLMGQLRYRYPILSGRLVPYAVLAGGAGLGEFSGRVDFDFDGGGDDWAPVGVFGLGAEYFVANNIAIGLESKYLVEFHPQIRLGSERPALNADSIGVSAGMRVYFDHLAAGGQRTDPPSVSPHDTAERRPYVGLRLGRGFFTDTGTDSGVEIDRVSGLLPNIVVGMNVSRYFGAELAFEYTRSQLHSATLGDITGYPVWTVSLLGRARYPIYGDRVVPYLLGGVGIGYGETGDLDQPFEVARFAGGQDRSVVGVVGGGIEYFLEPNVAVGIEAKYTSHFSTDFAIDGVRDRLSPEEAAPSPLGSRRGAGPLAPADNEIVIFASASRKRVRAILGS